MRRLFSFCLFVLVMLCHSFSAFAVPDVGPWDASKAKPLPYAIYKVDKDHRKGIDRVRLEIRLVLVEKGDKGQLLVLGNQDKHTKEELAATVVAAAKFYVPEAHMISVSLESTNDTSGYGNATLANVKYAPDGKGASGKPTWVWDMAQAAERGATNQEVTMMQLWGQMRGQYQTSGETNEPALKAAIAKKMKVSPDIVTLPFFWLHNIPQEILDAVEPAGAIK